MKLKNNKSIVYVIGNILLSCSFAISYYKNITFYSKTTGAVVFELFQYMFPLYNELNECFQDWKLVNSISATERVALWDKFSAPVDQHAIKIDFIRRARRARPALRLVK